METELKNLRIDRTARRSREGKPVVQMVILAIVLVGLAIGGLVAYQKMTAPVDVQISQVPSPMADSATAANNEIVLTATGSIVAAHKLKGALQVNGRVEWIGVDKAYKVKEGQVMVRLENTEFRAQLQQQQRNLSNLEAKLAELQNGSRPEEI